MKAEIETVDVAIIGSGISGLAANLKAIESGRHPVIFESRSTAGGLLDSFEINGFTFDRAVHLSFAHEKEVRAVFDKTNYITHPAVSRCFDNMIWTKHPIQNNLYPYPVEKKISYIQSFFDRPEALNDNYESWLRHQYGNLIAEDFPIRYTKKYWRVNPEELSINWVGERMRRSDSHEILHGAFTSDTPHTYYTKEMRYPDKGGYKSFIRPLLDSGKIELNKKLIDIDVDRKKLKFEDGSYIFFKQLVSTIPLPEIIAVISQAPAEVVTASRKLFATSVDLISIGFSKNLTSDLWFYIYDDEIFASRAYSPSVKSPNNAPVGYSSIQFEIYSRGKSQEIPTEKLVENSLYALKKLQIGAEEDILFLDHRRIEYGNVVFYKGMEIDRKIVLDYLSTLNILSCGRFGEWDYLWSNQSFMSGYNLKF